MEVSQVNKSMSLVGVDVDSRLLVCCLDRGDDTELKKTFSNTPSGHSELVKWATQDECRARVCLESTGVYSLSLAFHLDAAANVEVSVVNPRAIKNFAKAALQRGKTDAMDARLILEYLKRMHFKAWQAPAREMLELQTLSRRVVQLNTELSRERSRRHAALRLGESGRFVVNDLEVCMRHISRRLVLLEEEIQRLIDSQVELSERYRQLESITGIAKKSGPKILAELGGLPSDMEAKQWVAYSGLDPRPDESGSNTHKPRRITKQGNRYLRNALYLPALVASQRDKHVKAYYEHLLAKGKKPKQALVAIMRKLLLAIWGMFQTGELWQGEKFYKIV